MKNKNFENKDEKRQKIDNFSRDINSGVISFTEENEEKSLALNPVRYLIPLDSSSSKKKEKLDIDYIFKDKDEANNKNFEIIIEVNPKDFEENKNKRRRGDNLPLPRINYINAEDKNKSNKIGYGSLFYDYLEIYLNRTKNIERQFFEDYFDL